MTLGGTSDQRTSADLGPVLTISGLSKTFGGEHALNNVDFELCGGEVHALVGQNGSGKSTLIKVLAGYHQADPGASATVDGKAFDLGHAGASFAAGLRFVHQDLGLVPALGAVDNLALGRGYRRGKTGTISWRRELAAGGEQLRSLGYDFDLNAPVGQLLASERTGIAIARALDTSSGDARVLVLDEPTASMPAAEVRRLFRVIRAVRDSGVGVIYVSHRFGEVFEIADRVTVLRDGVRVGTFAVGELDESELIRLTIGRTLAGNDVTNSDARQVRPDPILQVSGLVGRNIEQVSLDVHAGEIVGIAGVTGSGREEIAELMFADRAQGEVSVAGQLVPAGRPDLSIRRGMALLPADRLSKAALRDMTLRDNLTISRLNPFYGVRGLSRQAERQETAAWLDRLGVVPPDPEAILLTLSGGNQQKVMLGRALRLSPRVLVLDEPTQGVDVGAKAAIYDIVKDAARAGTAVLVVSTESEELVGLCDRIIVISQGAVRGVFAASELTADALTELTMREDSSRRLRP
jgi:ribose transport system ATP-binding protein